jgi:hypothetical protein
LAPEIVRPIPQPDAIWKFPWVQYDLRAGDVDHVLVVEIDQARPVVDRELCSFQDASVSDVEVESAATVNFIRQVADVLRPCKAVERTKESGQNRC